MPRLLRGKPARLLNNFASLREPGTTPAKSAILNEQKSSATTNRPKSEDAKYADKIRGKARGAPDVPVQYIGQAGSLEELQQVLSKTSQLLPQIALVARSNAGKSSLVNALLGQPLAIVSKMPGRTRFAHAYQAKRFVIIDLPGYGFAEGIKKQTEEASRMSNVVADVVFERLRTDLVLLLLDARRMGPMSSDESMMNAMVQVQRPYEIVFTKVDAISNGQCELLKEMYPEAWFTSSRKLRDIKELKQHLAKVRLSNP